MRNTSFGACLIFVCTIVLYGYIIKYYYCYYYLLDFRNSSNVGNGIKLCNLKKALFIFPAMLLIALRTFSMKEDTNLLKKKHINLVVFFFIN